MENITETILSRIELLLIEAPEDGRILGPEHFYGVVSSIEEMGPRNAIPANSELVLSAHPRHVVRFQPRECGHIPAQITDGDLATQPLMACDENLLRRDLNVYETAKTLARRKEVFEEIHPDTRHGGRRVAGQKCNGHKSFITDTAEKTGRHKDTIGKLARIGTRLIELPPDLNGHPIMNSGKQLDLLSRQAHEVQQAIVEMLVAQEAETVGEALAARNGHNGAAGRDEAEVLPDNSPEAAAGPESQDGMAPSCSAEADNSPEAPVAASGDLTPDGRASGDSATEVEYLRVDEYAARATLNCDCRVVLPNDCPREYSTRYSAGDAELGDMRFLIKRMEGKPEIFDGWEKELIAKCPVHEPHNDADSGRDEAEVLPENSKCNCLGVVPPDRPREYSTLYSAINARLQRLRFFFKPKIVDDWAKKLDKDYRAYVLRNGRECPSLTPNRSTTT